MGIGLGLLLYVVVLLVVAYALYWIVRKAVAHGIADARRTAQRSELAQRDLG